MSQQLQITGGAKVRDLQDVIIGTSGVLSSLAFNVANGVPKLDVNGKILVSQLPNSVMEYQGTWNAATNTPTLVNGTGNQGDVYLCNVAGTTNFGAGPITFAVGDSAIYSGTIWQRAGGATGTVTSVGLTSTGNDAITITGSPITTSGNINLGFAGTNLQYINGAGDLTTFPTLISSIGLSMPSAFSVANSPLTANGTIAVTGAGYPSQYIRGDGTLADFPTSGGGGSSVSYYLNGGTSQGTIGGVTYYEMSKTADTGTGVDFNKTGDGFIVAFLTDAGDPAQLNIPAGNWNYEIYASMSANGGTPEMYAELYKYDGTTFTLISTSSNEILYDGTNLNLYTFAMTVPSTTLAITDRLAIKLYATNSGGKTTTVHTQDSHLCQIITTFSTGITALNGLTAQVQYFATGTSGTDFAISSSVATHTFNLPVASASNTGKLSSSDWSTFNGKVPYTGATANVDLGNFNFDANEIRGGSIIAKLNGLASSPFILMTGSSGYIFGYDAISMISSPTTANTLILTSNIGVVTKTAQIGLGSLTATRTYTLPDASGTLALTSDLGSYVTLATTQTITAQKSFSNLLIADKGVILATGSTTFLAGSTTLNGNANGLTIGLGVTISGTTTNYAHQLLFPQLTPQTYTYPAASGTLALTSDLTSFVTLTGIQTLSNKSFSNEVNLSSNGFILAGTGGVNPLQMYSTANTSTFLFGSNSFGTNINNNLFYSKDSNNRSVLVFNNTAERTYTFPNASGTLALTSDLGSYLPLTGGTLTGQLYINPTNTATVGLDVASNTIRFRSDNLEGFKRQLEITMGSGTLVQMVAKGFGANYGTDLAFYTATTGGVNASPAIYITSGNKIGILNGTPSATFDVTGTGAFSSTITAVGYSKFWNGSNSGLLIGNFSANAGYGAIYSQSVTPSTTNFALASNGLSTIINATNDASIVTNNGNGLVVMSTGNVIINNGTTDSGSKLQIVGGINFRSNSGYNGWIISQTGGSASAAFNLSYGAGGASNVITAEYNTGEVTINGSATAGKLTIGYNFYILNDQGPEITSFVATSGSSIFRWMQNTTSEVMRLQSGGVLKINNIGSGAVTATSGVLSATSDMNLKISDGYIDTALDKILKLTPRYFYWKEETGLPTDLRQLGFYAQEVNEAIGEEGANTPRNENDKWGIYDRAIIAMLTKGMQEQQSQIEELKTQIQTLLNK